MTTEELNEKRVQLEYQKQMLFLQINRSSDKEEIKEVKKEIKKLEKEVKKLREEYIKISKEKIGGKVK